MERRPRIAWFSPLPPMRSGIADNVVPVLAALRTTHEVELWIDAEAGTCETYGLRARRYALPAVGTAGWDDPTTWSLDWHALNTSEGTVYHIGNQADFHGAMWRVASVHPGLVVLHDESLQHLFAALLRAGGGFAGDRRYLAAMAREHGAEGLATGRALLAGAIDIFETGDRCPLTRLGLLGAAGVVVHSPAFLERVQAWYRGPSAHMPLPFKPTADAEDEADARDHSPAAVRLRGGRPCAVVMGHLGANRCLPEICEALGDPEFAAWELRICGEVAPSLSLAGMTAAHGLEGRVDHRGYLQEAALRRAIVDADLAINLRNPTMGEASATQLTLWDARLPVIASRTGWYATLPEGSTAYVEPGEEVEGVRAHLRAYARDPAPYRAMGARGRLALERDHSPSKYAAGLVTLLERMRGAPGHGAVEQVIDRIVAAAPWHRADDAALMGGVAAALADLLGGGKTGEAGEVS